MARPAARASRRTGPSSLGGRRPPAGSHRPARAPGPMSRSGTGTPRSTGSGRGVGRLDRAATPWPPAAGRARRGPRALRRAPRPWPPERCVPVAVGADGPAARRGPPPGPPSARPGRSSGRVGRSGRRAVRRLARVPVVDVADVLVDVVVIDVIDLVIVVVDVAARRREVGPRLVDRTHHPRGAERTPCGALRVRRGPVGPVSRRGAGRTGRRRR